VPHRARRHRERLPPRGGRPAGIPGQPDATLRAYAAVSLARVGGGDAAPTLDRVLRKGEGGVRPFAALAIGILSRRTPERAAVPLLRKALDAENSPDTKAAIALGLALAADEASIPALRDLLTAFDSVPLRGHAAVALAILRDRESREGIRRLLDPAVPPAIQREAALAAGLVTDSVLEKQLVERLLKGETELARGTAAVALGRMRAIDAAGALARILRDRGHPGALRALAAEALGRVLGADGTPPETRLTSGLHLSMVPAPLAEVIRSL
jgi:HEAT repeat protein